MDGIIHQLSGGPNRFCSTESSFSKAPEEATEEERANRRRIAREVKRVNKWLAMEEVRDLVLCPGRNLCEVVVVFEQAQR